MNIKNVLLVLIAILVSLTLAACGNDSSAPAATDYSQAAHWLSLPVAPATPDKKVDVFYLYPTAWTNADPNPQISAIDEPSMLIGAASAFARQASVFATVGNIYAPYYRQDNSSSIDRLKVIAGIPTLDAVAAFDYYIKHFNNGRPFILAGHSQGSTVLSNLLSGYMKDHPEVKKNMVAAYVIGHPVTQAYLNNNPHLKFATGPDDTGVIISYNTQALDVVAGTNPVLYGMVGLVINPVTWSLDENNAPVTNPPNLGVSAALTALIPSFSAADAKIDKAKGVLVCSNANEDAMFKLSGALGKGVYHSFDYLFYYNNLTANAQNRVEKFLAVQSQKALQAGFKYMQNAVSSSDNRVGHLNKALASVNSSIQLAPSQDALLLKAYILTGMDKLTEAHSTLDQSDAQYPNSGADEHVRALLLSKQKGDPVEILKDLKISMNDTPAYSGIPEETWWKTIEGLPDFGYFRNTPQYAVLEALKPAAKPVAKTVGSAYVCTENVTKYEAHWYGSAVYLKESDVTLLDDILGLAKRITEIIGDALDEVLPGLGDLLAGIFGIAKDLIKHEDKHGCGVILNIPWIPEFFIPTTQK